MAAVHVRLLALLLAAVALLVSADVSERAKKVKENFAQEDKDNDGKLSLEELTTAREKMGSKDPATHAKGTISKMDEDGDGAVSLKEFFTYNHIPHDEL
eukprot:gnl/TRDRNA2_/TRDRNA2_38621_c0_seq1.p1 gnl/TRDRNA2_/TRDRNA2_38621_c0~~gnl/TRDRNA2_/TRDRNA2_38621_c0_seq1.p1  ORF type:complete len:113 (-),score=31.10 gnl/TRDRNA2_/TRDRNA2_38621_c0_seq1:126-422(-)